MPSTKPLPTITRLVRAASAALQGERNVNGDTRSGSLYNHIAGPQAILFAREADRDQDLFQDIYFNNAEGVALTNLIQQRFPGVNRILDTYGQGICTFTRASDAGGEGTFLDGTRIQVVGTPPSTYVVAADTNVSATALQVDIPIQANVIGTGQAISNATGLSLVDPLWDNTWTPILLNCADGTDFEDAATYRALALQTKLNARTGYLAQITLACQNAGAAYVIAFPSEYGLLASDFTNDFGLNALYVADAAFQSPPHLVRACSSVLESWRTLGADLLIGGVANTPLQLNFLVSLTDNPAKLPVQSIRRLCSQALLAAFGPTDGGFSYSIASLSAAVNNASPYVQTAHVPGEWFATTTYALGDLVFDEGVQQCILPGETGLSTPAFSPVPGAVTFDGSVQWQCTAYPSTGIYAAGALELTDPVLTALAWPAALPRYTLNFAGMNFYFTGPL